RAPLYLPSFPTRRSSDLFFLRPVQVLADAADRKRRGGDLHAERRREISEPGGRNRYGDPLGLFCRDGPRGGHQRFVQTGVADLIDRKSTRLNSSHLVISY